MDLNISDATKRNWDKLNFNVENKLTQRANKQYSKKKFMPIEYFVYKENITKVQNIIEKLNNYSIKDIIFTFGKILLNKNNLLNKEHVINVLSEYEFNYLQELETFDLPLNERDILGIIYQSLLFEGDKNKKGSYYTPKKVVFDMVKELDFSSGQTFLDPCCGSGSFLLELENVHPNQIYGYDIDEIATFIAKINLLIKYKEIEFIPNIKCDNFLEDKGIFELVIQKYDYIVTNPPWGANTENVYIEEITSKETFSYFFVKSFQYLKDKGIIKFLVPKSVLNVKVHKDLRDFILNKTCFESFTLYNNDFTGVTTEYVNLVCSKNESKKEITYYSNNNEIKIDKSNFTLTKNHIFNILNETDISIINKVREKSPYNLSNSKWALGIVTGDNKSKLSQVQKKGFEPILTGKEISPFILKAPINYVEYKRENFQQVAKDEYYRAKEKLVYKFISNKLVFAYDNKQRLFLNSANILIPKVPNMSIKTVMGFLNSELYQFLYIKLFNEIKILRGNLEELPFQKLNQNENNYILNIVNKIFYGFNEKDQLNDYIYNVFSISEVERNYIKKFLEEI